MYVCMYLSVYLYLHASLPVYIYICIYICICIYAYDICTIYAFIYIYRQLYMLHYTHRCTTIWAFDLLEHWARKPVIRVMVAWDWKLCNIAWSSFSSDPSNSVWTHPTFQLQDTLMMRLLPCGFVHVHGGLHVIKWYDMS